MTAAATTTSSTRPAGVADVAGIEAGPYDALLVNDARVLGDEQRANDPNEAGAREFVRILGEQGIAVTGGAGDGHRAGRRGRAGDRASHPLPAVIAEMLTNSDNNTAELMLKEIGLTASGAGTRQAGADAIASTLAGWGIDTTGLVVADGSGLSLDNRITCRTMLAVLQHAGFDRPGRPGTGDRRRDRHARSTSSATRAWPVASAARRARSTTFRTTRIRRP